MENEFSTKIRNLLEQAGFVESLHEQTGFEIYYGENHVVIMHVQAEGEKETHAAFLRRYLDVVQKKFPKSEIKENVVSIWKE